MVKSSLEQKCLELLGKDNYVIIFVEPLKEFPFNLKYCNNKDECQWLEEYLSQDIFAARELITSEFCHFCQSDKWIIVAATDGLLLTFIVEPNFGKQVKKLLKQKMKRRSGES